MIAFAGDLALGPVGGCDPIPDVKAWQSPLVINLEGPLVGRERERSQTGLWTSADLFDRATTLNIRGVSLANNHIADDGIAGLVRTVEVCQEAGILPLGMRGIPGYSWMGRISSGSAEWAILGAGWKLVGCRIPGRRGVSIVDINDGTLIEAISSLKKTSRKVAVFVHWGYELEPWPQPGHRILAHAWIRAGADVVVGAHPHVLGPFEVYEGAPILYSIGNWRVRRRYFMNGAVDYGEEADDRVIAEWIPDGWRLHHYRLMADRIKLIRSDALRRGSWTGLLDDITDFTEGDYQAEYLSRKRRRTLPTWTGFESTLSSRAKEAVVRTRTGVARATWNLRRHFTVAQAK